MKSTLLHLTAVGMLSAAMVLGSPSASADVDVTFDATGTFLDGTTLGGNLLIDTTVGKVLTADFLFSGAPGSQFNSIASQGFNSTADVYEIFATSATSADELRLGTLAGSLIGFTGGALDSALNPSATHYESGWQSSTGVRTGLKVGRLTAVPEPTALSLVGLGFAAVGLMWRRRRIVAA